MDEKYINKKVEEAMHSIDNISKATPAPFFFTRLEARMLMEKNTWYQLSSFFSKPVTAFACICLIILLNLAVIFKTSTPDKKYVHTNTDTAAVEEYSQVATNLYELDK